jgi:hypothetical protein
MKIIKIIFAFFLVTNSLFSQEHFTGISTSKRVGIINVTNNPAELINLDNKYEVNVFNFSTIFTNDQLTFSDLISGDDLEDKIFEGTEPVNVRIDALFYGPSFAFKTGKWGFGINSMANVKANAINIDPKLGEAIQSGDLSNALTSTVLSSNENQRINGITWGELGFSVARNVMDKPKHKINVGTNLRILFPGAYSNFAASNLNGTVVNNFGDISLINASANVNVAYAGVLANDYNDQGSYNEFFSQGINGFAADIAVNYRWKNEDKPDDYRLNAGLSIKNMGSMTFKSDNNIDSNYILNVEGTESLDLNQFQSAESITDIEAIINDPSNADYFQVTTTKKDFTVKLPTVLNMYADVKVVSKFYVTGSINQKLKDDSENAISTTQNSYALIPRFVLKKFEVYAPLASNEISGFTSGVGLRFSGFYMGSNSILSAISNTGKQADFYMGLRIGF